MIYAIPVFGWLLGLLMHASLAVPFWLFWNWLAPKFFYFVPEVYQTLGFWECVGLFVILSILKLALVPKLASISSTSENKS